MPDDEAVTPAVDLDEEHLKLLLVENARMLAAERSMFVGAVVGEIARISAGSATAARETWSTVLDEIEATTTQLLAQQACYRAAGAAIATPVAPSLLAFLS